MMQNNYFNKFKTEDMLLQKNQVLFTYFSKIVTVLYTFFFKVVLLYSMNLIA
tara:strand:- start:679 stop:834 length:156 start_codon:yes stop_codon:yes gene_type:complete